MPAQDTEDETYDLLAAHGMPTVTFLRRSGKGRFDHVGLENFEASLMATRHLTNLGHRRIAYFGGAAHFGVRTERIAGYTEGLAEIGVHDLVIWDTPDDKISGMHAMSALHKAHPDITALVCNGDMIAIGACAAINQMGMTPGQEISVIGFDDIQDSAIASPPLTTLAVSPYQLGRKLARVVLDRIRDPQMPTATSLIPAELIIRSTTGAPLPNQV